MKCFSFVITGVPATWPTAALFLGAGDTWENTTGWSFPPVLCSGFIKSTLMMMESTQDSNLPFK